MIADNKKLNERIFFFFFFFFFFFWVFLKKFFFLKNFNLNENGTRIIKNLHAGYIGEFEIIDDHRAGKIVIQLLGRINKCGVISPRYDMQNRDIESWQGRLLPSRQFGYFVITSSAGIMDHEEARRKHVGGKLLGYFY